MSLKTKLESEYQIIFSQNFDDILKQIMLMIDSTEFDLAIKLGKKFRTVCTNIGRDPRFLGMSKFLNLVRSKDRQIEDLIERIGRKLEKYSIPPPQSVTPVEKFESLYMHFYRVVDKRAYEIYQAAEKENANPDSSISNLFHKIKDYMQSKIKPSFTPEQLKLISEFRKKEADWSESQKLDIKKPISPKDDIQIFLDYAKPVEKQLMEFESRGWYNSTRQYTLTWLEYLEKIAKFHINVPAVVDVIRQEILYMKDWLVRVDNKYNEKPQLEYEEGFMLNDDIRELMLRYKTDRKEFRIHQEDKRILKIIEKENIYGKPTNSG